MPAWLALRAFFSFYYVSILLDPFFCMGINRHYCSAVIFAVFPLFCISQDSAIISALGDVESAVFANGVLLGDISYDVASIYSLLSSVDSDVASINSKLGNNFGSDFTSVKTSIQQVSSILSAVSRGGGGAPDHFEVQDYPLYSEVHEFKRDFHDYADTVTNQLSTTVNYLDSVLNAVNNLTNYLCYSKEYISSFPTNIVGLLIGSYLGNFYIGEQDSIYGYMELYNLLFGHYPSYSEASIFADVITRYGLSQLPLTQLLSHISGLPELVNQVGAYGFNLDDVYWSLYDSVPLGYDFLPRYGDLYYYEYGTRPLIDSFLAFTNQYFVARNEDLEFNRESRVLSNAFYHNVTNILNQSFESATNSYVNNTEVIAYNYDDQNNESNPSFAAGFVDAVGSLSSSFMPSVSTNVSNLSTGAIDNVENNSFQDFGNGLKSYDDSDLEGAVSLINNSSVIEDFAQYFESHQSGDFSFNFNLSQLGTGVGDISLTIPNSTSKTRSLIHFISGVLKVAITVIFISKAWNDVIKPSPLFFP